MLFAKFYLFSYLVATYVFALSDTTWAGILVFATMVAKELLDQRRARITAAALLKVDEKVEVVHKATNSMKDQLVEVTKQAEHLEGEKVGRAAEKADVQAAKDELVEVTVAKPAVVKKDELAAVKTAKAKAKEKP